MADPKASSQSPAPAATLPSEHTPYVPSPLNPDAAPRQPSKTPAPPVQREQREKKETLKKRESAVGAGGSGGSGGGGSSTLGKRKANATTAHPSPQRFNIPQPQPADFRAPREDQMTHHEPLPFVTPDGEQELFKPLDLAENKRGYRYTRAIADPEFPHKQFYRSTSPPPHGARFSFEDADKWMHFTTNALLTTNEKGWRMTRANVCAREGTLYYEVKIHRGVPSIGPNTEAVGPQPHVRFGWARREAPLDAPVGYDGYSYGVTDIRFETMHRSRPGRFFHAKKAAKTKSAKAAMAPPQPVNLAPEDSNVKEGDIIGVELQLPSLALHQKIVSGVYNPAVERSDGFDETKVPLEPGAENQDVIRDRIPVAYKGNNYFETLDHVASKPMESYADRTANLSSLPNQTSQFTKDAIKTAPNPNHDVPALRTLPHSAMRVYKNGKLIGTAFENLLSFLPQASAPSKTMGAREGFDDGMVGYYPAVSCFHGGIAEVNFGDSETGFWMPPAHLRPTPHARSKAKELEDGDVVMVEAGGRAEGAKGWVPGRIARAVGERYKEQVAEDIVWDLVDEVDFFVQDGGFGSQAGAGADTVGGARRVKMEE
ncbi:hypothetical protein MBLNU230_g4519t1 [Neophaeotheca triangularis]